MIHRATFIRLALCAVAGLPFRTWSADAVADAPRRKPDLGDAAQGSYAGEVISDSKGSSQSGVGLTVSRIGRNLVRITSDYPRLPVVEVPLTQAMGKIVQARGNTAFVLDATASPPRLDVSFLNEASWSGERR
jgi:hypothetical protein